MQDIFLQNVQTGCRVHTASNSMGTGSLFQKIKQSGREATTHLHVEPRLRTKRDMPIFPLAAFMAWRETTKKQ
jgi:hypothetical protein